MKKLKIFVFLILCTRAVSGQVSITSTEGNLNGIYVSLKTSFDAINAGVHKGKIIVTIYSSIIETSTARLNGSEGFSNYTSVTIMPSTICTISGNLRDALIDLNGADNVIIDGRINGTGSTRNLTISNTYAVPGQNTSAIRFINGALHNTIKFLTLEGSGQSFDAGTVWIAQTNSAESNSFNVIDNNEIKASQAGLPAAGIRATPHIGPSFNQLNSILNNDIHDFFSETLPHAGISIDYQNTKYLISGNSVYQTRQITGTAVSQGAFIALYYGEGHVVRNNFVGGSAPKAQGSPCTYNGDITMSGIFVYAVGYTNPTNLDGNVVSNLTFNYDASNPARGTPIFNGFRIHVGKINLGVYEPNVIGSLQKNGDIKVNVIGTSNPVNMVAIACLGSVRPDDYSIFNNKVGGLLATGQTGSIINIYGIHANAVTSLIISKNTIGGGLANSIENRSFSGAIRGITLEHQVNSSKYTCTENIVQNINDNTSGTSEAIIIGIDGSNFNDNNNLYQTNISNNLVTNLYSNNITAGNGSVTGIYLNQSIYNNTSQMNGIIYKNVLSNLFSASQGSSTTVVGISNNCRFTNMVIDSNKINNLSSFSSSPGQHQTASVQGINSIYSSNAPLSITGNEIRNLANLNTSQSLTSTVGIMCFPAGNNTAIAKNKVVGLSTRNSNSTVAGIALKGVGGSGIFNVTNNMVALNDSANVYGIINDVNANRINLYYNSVSVGGVGNAVSKSAAFFREVAASTSIESFNNIFHNSRTGGANYAIINSNTNPTIGWSNLNYNNLYSSSPNTITLWSSVTLNLPEYKRLSLQEKCSISQDVEFVDRNNGDLHLKDVESNLTLAGTSIPGISIDFDGDTRHFVPTMGADEKIINLQAPIATFTGPLIFCEGNKVALKSSISTGIQWYKDGVAIIGAAGPTYDATVSGNYSVQLSNECQPLKSNVIPVTVNPTPATPGVSPNGPTTFCSGQSVTLNSTASNNQWYRNNILIPGETAVNLVVIQEGAYSVTNTFNGCVSAASTPVNVVVKQLPPTPVISHVEKVLISSATLGNQWYLNGSIIPGATNQQYTPTQEGIYSVQVTSDGCFSAASANYSFIKTIVLYPNPVRDMLNIRITGYSERVLYVVYDAIGRKLREQQVNLSGPSNIIVNMQALPGGVYSLSVMTSDGITTKRILKH